MQRWRFAARPRHCQHVRERLVRDARLHFQRIRATIIRIAPEDHLTFRAAPDPHHEHPIRHVFPATVRRATDGAVGQVDQPLHGVYAVKRSRAVEASLVGIVSVNVPAVTVWLPNVCTETALSPCVEL
jgi:hypothetical protein